VQLRVDDLATSSRQPGRWTFVFRLRHPSHQRTAMEFQQSSDLRSLRCSPPRMSIDGQGQRSVRQLATPTAFREPVGWIANRSLSSLNRLAERVPDALHVGNSATKPKTRMLSADARERIAAAQRKSRRHTLQVASFLVNTITSHFEMCPFTLFLCSPPTHVCNRKSSPKCWTTRAGFDSDPPQWSFRLLAARQVCHTVSHKLPSAKRG
jgi:hypothetical protein